MNKRVKVEFSDLEARLGYRFRNPDLATLALTHLSAQTEAGGPRRSPTSGSNFWATACSALSVADHLYSAFPQASEGELSMRLAKLVRRETCAAIAAEWDVGPHVVLGLGEARGGGRKKAAILSDVCESLIGAVFVDGGFEAARDLILRAWGDRADGGRRARARRQDRGAGMGAGAGARRRRTTRRPPAAGPRTRRTSSCASCSRATSPRPAKRAPSAPPNRPPPRPSSTGGAQMSADPLRLRRADRRAQRRQVDADQRARRREGGDRHPQGADDALDRARRVDARRGPDRLRRHARAFSRRSAASTGRWSPPPGARRQTPTCWRC